MFVCLGTVFSTMEASEVIYFAEREIPTFHINLQDGVREVIHKATAPQLGNIPLLAQQPISQCLGKTIQLHYW